MGRLAFTASIAIACAAPALAHIVIADPRANAGSYHVAAFRVGHGCNGSPTVSLRVEVPAAITSAKPQPKPGWIMRAESVPLPRPIVGEGGVQQVQRVAAVTWMGRLDPDQFDEFKLLMKLPDSAGPLHFPVLQRCEQGEAAWTEIPARGQPRQDLKLPAPVLDVAKAAPSPAAHH
jgi:periplasmic copper chaperone A